MKHKMSAQAKKEAKQDELRSYGQAPMSKVHGKRAKKGGSMMKY